MFYLTTHSTHFIYGYMASDIWLRTILIVRKETRCCHIGYSYRLTARVLLYAPSYRQDNTYHGLCYTSRGALAGTRNSSMGPPHEGSIRRPTAPWANTLPLSYVLLPKYWWVDPTGLVVYSDEASSQQAWHDYKFHFHLACLLTVPDFTAHTAGCGCKLKTKLVVILFNGWLGSSHSSSQ